VYFAQGTKWLRSAVPCLSYLRVLSFDISVYCSPRCIDRTFPVLRIERKLVTTPMQYLEINPHFQRMLKFRFYFLVAWLFLRCLLNHQHVLCGNISKSTLEAIFFTNGRNLRSTSDTINDVIRRLY
jgi:hypothetical protein